jgi:hypothetical protein
MAFIIAHEQASLVDEGRCFNMQSVESYTSDIRASQLVKRGYLPASDSSRVDMQMIGRRTLFGRLRKQAWAKSTGYQCLQFGRIG